MHLEIGVSEPVHSHHPPIIIAIERIQARDGSDATEQDNREQRNGDRDERPAEAVSLRDQRKSDYSTRQDGQEYGHPAQRFGVGKRTGCKQAPVLSGQDLQLGGGPRFPSSWRNIGRHVFSSSSTRYRKGGQ